MYLCRYLCRYVCRYLDWLCQDHVTALWTWLFVLSKLPELVDTVFIVLRKQKLIFLHWYGDMVTV